MDRFLGVCPWPGGPPQALPTAVFLLDQDSEGEDLSGPRAVGRAHTPLSPHLPPVPCLAEWTWGQARVGAWVRHRRAVWWRLQAWLGLPVLSQCHCLCAWPPADDQFPQQTGILAARGLGADAVSRCVLGDSTKLTLVLPPRHVTHLPPSGGAVKG